MEACAWQGVGNGVGVTGKEGLSPPLHTVHYASLSTAKYFTRMAILFVNIVVYIGVPMMMFSRLNSTVSG